MDQVLGALDATWRILLVGVLLGSGLPALFAVGVRALAWGSTSDDTVVEPTTSRPKILGRVVAYLAFSVVVLAVFAGVGYIVAHGLGMTITFNGLLPVFTPKH